MTTRREIITIKEDTSVEGVVFTNGIYAREEKFFISDGEQVVLCSYSKRVTHKNTIHVSWVKVVDASFAIEVIKMASGSFKFMRVFVRPGHDPEKLKAGINELLTR